MFVVTSLSVSSVPCTPHKADTSTRVGARVRWCMCVFLCVCLCVCMHVCTYASVRVCMDVCKICVYVFECVCVCAGAATHAIAEAAQRFGAKLFECDVSEWVSECVSA